MLALLSLTILQGDRYEGFFSNNKFDGQGSYYERDAISGKVTATHGTWQVNLPYKPLSPNPDSYCIKIFSNVPHSIGSICRVLPIDFSYL